MTKTILFTLVFLYSSNALALTCDEYMKGEFDKSSGFQSADEQVDAIRKMTFEHYPRRLAKLAYEDFQKKNMHDPYQYSLMVYETLLPVRRASEEIFSLTVKEAGSLKTALKPFCRNPSMDIKNLFEAYFLSMQKSLSEVNSE